MPINKILWTRWPRRSASICWAWALRRVQAHQGGAPGRSSCSFAEFAAYASETFAQQTPVLKPSPLLDGSDVWKVPRDEVLYVDVELEPSSDLHATEVQGAWRR